MADLDAIARGLQGFGAGVAGRGPEFLQGLQQQEQRLDNQRKNALLQDSFTVMQHLKRQEPGRAREVIINRLEAIKQLGGDPSDTLGLLTKIDAGDFAGAFNDVSTVVNFAQAQGLLKTPTGSKPTSLIQNIEATGLQRGTPEFQDALRAHMARSGQTINVGDGAGLTTDEKVNLAARTKRAEELAKKRGAGVAQRESDDIDSGLRASREVPNLKRSLDLLKSIETGGIDAALLKGKQFLGIESKDEAELVNSLSQNVLQQLRPIFGAQFTKAEGDWLKAIEAGPNKSTAGNIRLLERGLKLAKRRASTGQKAAIEGQDFRTAQEIKDFLVEDFTPTEESGNTVKFLGFE